MEEVGPLPGLEVNMVFREVEVSGQQLWNA